MAEFARIAANGDLHRIEPELELTVFLGRLGLSGKRVIVELNGRALSPSEHEDVVLKDGDSLEIVGIVAGG